MRYDKRKCLVFFNRGTVHTAHLFQCFFSIFFYLKFRQQNKVIRDNPFIFTLSVTFKSFKTINSLPHHNYNDYTLSFKSYEAAVLPCPIQQSAENRLKSELDLNRSMHVRLRVVLTIIN
jgi:hypothetical protein